jgi:hypothetical protein
MREQARAGPKWAATIALACLLGASGVFAAVPLPTVSAIEVPRFLDDNYQWVAVSAPGRAYLWTLSRTPRMDAPTYASLLIRLSGLGLDVQNLALTPQD